MFEWLRRKNAVFTPAEWKASEVMLHNPGRGWYRIYTFRLPEEPDFSELIWCLDADETLAMVMLHIGAYANRSLDDDALRIADEVLAFFGRENKDVILRIVYDNEGRGLEHEPLLFSRLEEHIGQLAPILRKHADTIYILQGLMLGSWGEMHGSKFLGAQHMRRLYQLTAEAVGEGTWLAVRRPSYWRVLHGEGILQRPDAIRMGLFNDGLLGSGNHLGTYGDRMRVQVGWEGPWCPEEENAFTGTLCSAVPHGGEAVYPLDGQCLSPRETVDCLRRLHVSYLNSRHDMRLLEAWKDRKTGEGSLYDYIGAHMGYRFCIRSADVYGIRRDRLLEVTVENTGFAPCYEVCDITIVIKEDGRRRVLETPWDIRTLQSGASAVWKLALPVCAGDVYISATRRKDGRRLYFAQMASEDGEVLLGRLR